MLQESGSADRWLSRTLRLVPVAIAKANSAGCFVARWSSISSKLESVPPCLSDLSSHPLFARSALCVEQLQLVSVAVSEVIELADRCSGSLAAGKLQMQSELDAVAARLELCVRDCRLLIKTGVLDESSCPDASPRRDDTVRELLARLQIGHCEAKRRAVDGLLEALRDDEKSVVALLGRSSIAALVELLAATAPKTREKAATAVCLLAESGNCESLLISEGVLPPLIRLIESGTSVAREKAVASLQRLSTSAETARSIAGHGGIRPLVEACRTGESISQLAAVGALRNLSGVPGIAQSLVDEGVTRLMVDIILDTGIVSGLKEHAAECLQSLTSCCDDSQRLAAVASEGAIGSLVAYLDDAAASAQEPAAGALSNLVDHVSVDTLLSLGVLPRLVHVLEHGSAGAGQAAASAIYKMSKSSEMLGRLAGGLGCLPLLLSLLDAKSDATREVAAQAIASLMACTHNRREVRKERTSVPSLVRLLDPSPQNAAAAIEHAACCLLYMASSGRCRRRMVAYGAVGYLKKLVDGDVPGAKRLLERLERGALRNLFSIN